MHLAVYTFFANTAQLRVLLCEGLLPGKARFAPGCTKALLLCFFVRRNLRFPPISLSVSQCPPRSLSPLCRGFPSLLLPTTHIVSWIPGSVPQLQPPQGVPLPPPGAADRSRLRRVGRFRPRRPFVGAGGQEQK